MGAMIELPDSEDPQDINTFALQQDSDRRLQEMQGNEQADIKPKYGVPIGVPPGTFEQIRSVAYLEHILDGIGAKMLSDARADVARKMSLVIDQMEAQAEGAKDEIAKVMRQKALLAGTIPPEQLAAMQNGVIPMNREQRRHPGPNVG